MGAGLRGLILPSAPGVCAWATPFCPFLAKTGGSRWDRVAKYIFFFQFDHTNDLYGFQYWRLIFKYKDLSMQPDLPGDLSLLVLTVQRAQHAARPAGELSLPVVQRVQHAAPNLSLLVLQSSTSSPTKVTYIAPYSRRHRRFSPSNAAALTRHYRPLLRMRQQPR